MTILAFIDSHTGLIAGGIFLLGLVVALLMGKVRGFFPALRELLSTKLPDGTVALSTKSCAYFAATWAVIWAWTKVVLATCRWIDRGNDPTFLFSGLLIALTGGSSAVYLLGKRLQGAIPTKDPDEQKPDTPEGGQG